jgi:hypothetical protein
VQVKLVNPKWIPLQITTYNFVSMLMSLRDGLCDSNVACMMLWSINLVLQNIFCCKTFFLRWLNTFKFFLFFIFLGLFQDYDFYFVYMH